MAVSGKGGGVYVGVNKVAEITNWTLDIEADMLESTNFDSNGWREYIAGLKGWTGSFEGQWKMSDINGQKALQDALLGGTTVSIKLDVNGTNNYTGSAFISTQGIETPVDDIVSVSFDFQGTAALTYA
jgi:predicted secreted protein